MMMQRSVSFWYLLTWKTTKSMGLYRDDWLSLITNENGPKLDHLRKNAIAIFHNEKLKIAIDTNLTTTDFLDSTLGLCTGKYYHYINPTVAHFMLTPIPTTYQHLETVTQNGEHTIIHKWKWIQWSKTLYKNALKSTGFNRNLKYENIQTTRPWNSQIKVVWFFLKLVQKHFCKPYSYRKMFNTNTIKLSDLYIKNLKKQHYGSIMKSGRNNDKRDCNCRNNDNCFYNGKFLIECIA